MLDGEGEVVEKLRRALGFPQRHSWLCTDGSLVPCCCSQDENGDDDDRENNQRDAVAVYV